MNITSVTGYAFVDPWITAIITGIVATVALAFSFSLGYFFAKAINTAIRTVLAQTKLERWVDAHGLSNALLGFRVTQIITVWIKVFTIVAFLGFGFSLVEGYLGVNLFVTQEIIIPFKNYLIGLAQSLILICGALFIGKYISNEVKSGEFLFSNQISGAIHIAIAYFVIVSTLPSLLPNVGAQIAMLLTYLLMALVAGIGLAIGLAFGLGLKDVISKSAVKNQATIEKYIISLGKR